MDPRRRRSDSPLAMRASERRLERIPPISDEGSPRTVLWHSHRRADNASRTKCVQVTHTQQCRDGGLICIHSITGAGDKGTQICFGTHPKTADRVNVAEGKYCG